MEARLLITEGAYRHLPALASVGKRETNREFIITARRACA
jgi:hypothetical protein